MPNYNCKYLGRNFLTSQMYAMISSSRHPNGKNLNVSANTEA